MNKNPEELILNEAFPTDTIKKLSKKTNKLNCEPLDSTEINPKRNNKKHSTNLITNDTLETESPKKKYVKFDFKRQKNETQNTTENELYDDKNMNCHTNPKNLDNIDINIHSDNKIFATNPSLFSDANSITLKRR